MNAVFRGITAAALAGASLGALAAPVIQSTLFFTDRWAASTAFPSLNGDYLHLFTTVESPDVPALVSAVATQGALVRNLDFYTTPIFAEKNFEKFLTNTTLTGAWGLAAKDSSPGTATATFPAIADPEFLPLLQAVQVTGKGTSPTVSWTLPDLGGFDPEGISVRAVVAATASQIFQSAELAPTATSFVIPGGVLMPGVPYEFRVMLNDTDAGRLENRSNAFSPLYTALVPEPGSWALMLAGGAVLVARRRSSRQR